MARLGFVLNQIREIEEARQKRLEQEPETGPHAMVRLLARVVGVDIETADMLVHEVLSRPMRDRKAVARYAGLTGAPDESGAKRREQGLAKAGNARVRRGMIQLAWRFLLFQKQSALARWYQARTADAHACIMVRIRTDLPNTSLWREDMRPMASSPRIIDYPDPCIISRARLPRSLHARRQRRSPVQPGLRLRTLRRKPLGLEKQRSLANVTVTNGQ